MPITNSLVNTSNQFAVGDNPGVTSATTPFIVGKNTNASVVAQFSNTTAGAASLFEVNVISDTSAANIIAGSSTHATARWKNRAEFSDSTTSAGVNLTTTAAAGDIRLYIAGNTLAAKMDSTAILTLTNPLGSASGGSGVVSPTGILTGNGASAFTTSTVTQFAPLLGGATNTVTSLAAMTNGQLVVGSTGVSPVLATITAGAGISVVNGAGTITIATVDSGFTWNDQTADLNPIVKENGYFADKASRLVLTLPTNAVQGDTYAIAGFGANGWQLSAGTGQIIVLGNQQTSVAGNLQSTNRWDQMEVICSPTTTTFIVRHAIGNITVA